MVHQRAQWFGNAGCVKLTALTSCCSCSGGCQAIGKPLGQHSRDGEAQSEVPTEPVGGPGQHRGRGQQILRLLDTEVTPAGCYGRAENRVGTPLVQAEGESRQWRASFSWVPRGGKGVLGLFVRQLGLVESIAGSTTRPPAGD